ncbi:MAG: hypothetical protein WKF77_09810 [Planctomycetaceae bacterium]
MVSQSDYGQITAVPRHREIKENLARHIICELSPDEDQNGAE